MHIAIPWPIHLYQYMYMYIISNRTKAGLSSWQLNVPILNTTVLLITTSEFLSIIWQRFGVNSFSILFLF